MSSLLVAFVFATVCVIASGFRIRKKLFAQSTESLPRDLSKAVRLWKGANLVSFCCALNPPIYGVVLKIAGSGWLVPGILFGLGLFGTHRTKSKWGTE